MSFALYLGGVRVSGTESDCAPSVPLRGRLRGATVRRIAGDWSHVGCDLWEHDHTGAQVDAAFNRRHLPPMIAAAYGV